MSLALELWRLLEGWDPAKHPRGPGGRFVHLGGGGHSKRSLADAVKGTAAAGPKRPTAGRSMSVADAVRHAARTSDRTGRPTRQSDAEHRARGAHDVADEVDRALAEIGVPPEQRAWVSGRARAAADAHGPRPAALPKASRAKAAPKADGESVAEPANPKVDAAAADIHSFVNDKLKDDKHGFVGLHDVRQHLGDRYSRNETDQALHQLNRTPGESGLRVIPVANTKALKQKDRDAALSIGGEDSHMVGLRPAERQAPTADEVARSEPEVPGGYSRDTLDSAPDRWLRNNLELERDRDPNSPKIGQLEAEIARRGAPASPAAKPRRTGKALAEEHVGQLVDKLKAASTRDEGYQALSGLTAPQLRQVASAAGIAVGSNWTKPRATDAIVDSAVGRRLDSLALSGSSVRPPKVPEPPRAVAVAAPSTFDAAKAAHGKEALYAAPKTSRVLSEAAATPEKRAEMLARNAKQPDDAHTRRMGGKGPSTNLGDGAGIGHEESARIDRSVLDYAHRSYLDMNKALHDGNGSIPAGTPEKTRQQIEDLDKLFSLVGTRQDSVLYRGTVVVGDPPDELHNPGFSSATADADIAKAFSKGYFNGAETGSARLPGTPTVYELRVPKGYPAVRLSDHPGDTVSGTGAAEVLLRRGTRARKVEDRGQVNGVRHVVYEVIPDGQ